MAVTAPSFSGFTRECFTPGGDGLGDGVAIARRGAHHELGAGVQGGVPDAKEQLEAVHAGQGDFEEDEVEVAA